MPEVYDQRGFGIYADFEDRYGERIIVKESSLATEECVWIFAGDGGSAHLTKSQARRVRDALEEWLSEGPDHGRLSP